MLIMVCSLVMDDTSIAMSRNALSETKEFDVLMEVSGALLWDKNQGFYHLLPDRLNKLDSRGEILWERELRDRKAIYAGADGVLLSRGEDLLQWDPLGVEEHSIIGFMEEPRVLDSAGGYHLLAGQAQGSETASAIHRGKIMWYYRPKRDIIISGSIAPGGDYSVLILIDEKAQSKLVLIDAQGEVVYEREDTLLLLARALEDGVVVISEDKAFRMDYRGNLLWEHSWDATLCRAHVNFEGYSAVILKKIQGNLYSHTETILSMLTPEGQWEWSYSLEQEPTVVKMDGEHVYLLDKSGLLILTRHGMLTSRIRGWGWDDMSVMDRERFILTQGGKSWVISTSGR